MDGFPRSFQLFSGFWNNRRNHVEATQPQEIQRVFHHKPRKCLYFTLSGNSTMQSLAGKNERFSKLSFALPIVLVSLTKSLASL